MSFLQKTNCLLGARGYAEGIHVDPRKVQAAQEYPVPQCVKDVQAFLGFTGYYRRFIRDYAKIAHPIAQLLRKDVPFAWSDECQLTFEQLKKALTTAPVLIYPDFDQPFILCTDASLQGTWRCLGAVRG